MTERISFAAACRDAAREYKKSLDNEDFEDLPGEEWERNAAALRALAALVEQIEQGTSDECSADDFCNRIAAGYQPEAE